MKSFTLKLRQGVSLLLVLILLIQCQGNHTGKAANGFEAKTRALLMLSSQETLENALSFCPPSIGTVSTANPTASLLVPATELVTEGPLGPSELSEDSSIGDASWQSFSNNEALLNSDDKKMIYVPSVAEEGETEISRYLTVSNFKFSLPKDAIIEGITVEIERSAGGKMRGAVSDNEIRLILGKGFGLVNKANIFKSWPKPALGQVESFAIYGGSKDLWGESISGSSATLTTDVVNHSSFGIALSVKASAAQTTASVDTVKMAVHYRMPINIAAVQSPVPAPDREELCKQWASTYVKGKLDPIDDSMKKFTGRAFLFPKEGENTASVGISLDTNLYVQVFAINPKKTEQDCETENNPSCREIYLGKFLADKPRPDGNHGFKVDLSNYPEVTQGWELAVFSLGVELGSTVISSSPTDISKNSSTSEPVSSNLTSTASTNAQSTVQKFRGEGEGTGTGELNSVQIKVLGQGTVDAEFAYWVNPDSGGRPKFCKATATQPCTLYYSPQKFVDIELKATSSFGGNEKIIFSPGCDSRKDNTCTYSNYSNNGQKTLAKNPHLEVLVDMGNNLRSADLFVIGDGTASAEATPRLPPNIEGKFPGKCVATQTSPCKIYFYNYPEMDPDPSQSIDVWADPDSTNTKVSFSPACNDTRGDHNCIYRPSWLRKQPNHIAIYVNLGNRNRSPAGLSMNYIPINPTGEKPQLPNPKFFPGSIGIGRFGSGEDDFCTLTAKSDGKETVIFTESNWPDGHGGSGTLFPYQFGEKGEALFTAKCNTYGRKEGALDPKTKLRETTKSWKIIVTDTVNGEKVRPMRVLSSPPNPSGFGYQPWFRGKSKQKDCCYGTHEELPEGEFLMNSFLPNPELIGVNQLFMYPKVATIPAILIDTGVHAHSKAVYTTKRLSDPVCSSGLFHITKRKSGDSSINDFQYTLVGSRAGQQPFIPTDSKLTLPEGKEERVVEMGKEILLPNPNPSFWGRYVTHIESVGPAIVDYRSSYEQLMGVTSCLDPKTGDKYDGGYSSVSYPVNFGHKSFFSSQIDEIHTFNQAGGEPPEAPVSDKEKTFPNVAALYTENPEISKNLDISGGFTQLVVAMTKTVVSGNDVVQNLVSPAIKYFTYFSVANMKAEFRSARKILPGGTVAQMHVPIMRTGQAKALARALEGTHQFSVYLSKDGKGGLDTTLYERAIRPAHKESGPTLGPTPFFKSISVNTINASEPKEVCYEANTSKCIWHGNIELRRENYFWSNTTKHRDASVIVWEKPSGKLNDPGGGDFLFFKFAKLGDDENALYFLGSIPRRNTGQGNKKNPTKKDIHQWAYTALEEKILPEKVVKNFEGAWGWPIMHTALLCADGITAACFTSFALDVVGFAAPGAAGINLGKGFVKGAVGKGFNSVKLALAESLEFQAGKEARLIAQVAYSAASLKQAIDTYEYAAYLAQQEEITVREASFLLLQVSLVVLDATNTAGVARGKIRDFEKKLPQAAPVQKNGEHSPRFKLNYDGAEPPPLPPDVQKIRDLGGKTAADLNIPPSQTATTDGPPGTEARGATLFAKEGALASAICKERRFKFPERDLYELQKRLGENLGQGSYSSVWEIKGEREKVALITHKPQPTLTERANYMMEIREAVPGGNLAPEVFELVMAPDALAGPQVWGFTMERIYGVTVAKFVHPYRSFYNIVESLPWGASRQTITGLRSELEEIGTSFAEQAKTLHTHGPSCGGRFVHGDMATRNAMVVKGKGKPKVRLFDYDRRLRGETAQEERFVYNSVNHENPNGRNVAEQLSDHHARLKYLEEHFSEIELLNRPDQLEVMKRWDTEKVGEVIKGSQPELFMEPDWE